MTQDFLSTIRDRGFIHDCTDATGSHLSHLSASNAIVAYIGFDLTAPSLHVGSLIQLITMRHLLRTGNRVIVLLGDATTRVGDPTGKDKARPVLTPAEIETNRQGILAVIDRIVGGYAFENAFPAPTVVHNYSWIKHVSYLDFLRDYAPLFSVNKMLAMDSVRDRLERQSHMSVLEFNYSMMQAMDFLHLFETEGCNLQIGGSDQWSNILGGVDLVRRKTGGTAIGLTTKLFTNSAGQKMGKTADGAIWLDDGLTSPFEFWQFWRNVEDGKVGEYLRLFTELSLEEIDSALADRSINESKILLATEVTTMVHGRVTASEVEKTARAISAGGSGDGAPSYVVDFELWQTGRLSQVFAKAFNISHGEAVRLIKGGGAKVAGQTISNELCPAIDALPNSHSTLLSLGKKRHCNVSISNM